jgi:cellulose synthase/poly-beta-1,6-N-acetylglucosamine synthase-like glycosyltransferase
MQMCCLTKRAPDAGDSAHIPSIFHALAFHPSDGGTPSAPAQVTQAVRPPYIVVSMASNASYNITTGDCMETCLILLYCILLTLILPLVFHRFLMFVLYFMSPKVNVPPQVFCPSLPYVTVQLPIYNEQGVVERLVESVCAIEYPPELLQIQILDDSNDQTTKVLARLVAKKRSEGIEIEHIHRNTRKGYKAGALNFGLPSATGELIAIFDADFVPSLDFLHKTVNYFSDSSVAVVQTRWGYLNRTDSWLTRLQVVLLDSQFEVEHRVRTRFPLLYHTNGSGVIWRKHTIESLGGWPQQHSAEDLDLAYLAQLAGWKCIYHPDILCAGELPSTVSDFESQQMKWAYVGSKSALFLLPKVWQSHLPLWAKLDGVLQLTGRWSPFIILSLVLLWLPVSFAATCIDWEMFWMVTTIVVLVTQGCLWTYFLASQSGSGYERAEQIGLVFLLSICGIGLSVTMIRGCLNAFLARDSGIPRTRKGSERLNQTAHDDGGLRGVNQVTVLEGLMSCYLVVSMVLAWTMGIFHAIPFLGFAAMGFLYLLGLSIRDSLGGKVFSS